VKEKSDSSNDSVVFVRVELLGDSKIIILESPLRLRNMTSKKVDVSIRDINRGSKLWRGCIVDYGEYLFVPVHLATNTSAKTLCLGGRVVMNLPGIGEGEMGKKQKKKKGKKKKLNSLISVSEVTIDNETSYACVVDGVDSSVGGSGESGKEICFRPPMKLKNYLAVGICCEVRVVGAGGGLSGAITGGGASVREDAEGGKGKGVGEGRREALNPLDRNESEWVSLGNIDCGGSQSFSECVDSDVVEIRFRFLNERDVDLDPDLDVDVSSENKLFPNWSSVVKVPGKVESELGWSSEVIVEDCDGVPLRLMMRVEEEGEELLDANRCISVWANFWVINGTGDKLEFTTSRQTSTATTVNHGGGGGDRENGRKVIRSSDTFVPDASYGLIAGQNYNRNRGNKKGNTKEVTMPKGVGLEALLSSLDLRDDRDHKPHQNTGEKKGKGSRKNFVVLMSDFDSSNLRIRNIDGAWSKAIPLRGRDLNAYKVDVKGVVAEGEGEHSKSKGKDLLSLNVVVLSAPGSLGGKLGTKVVSVVNRYTLHNFIGRDLEIFSEGSNRVVSLNADGKAVSFHFDDRKRVRFRPKEYGWGWSGGIRLTGGGGGGRRGIGHEAPK